MSRAAQGSEQTMSVIVEADPTRAETLRSALGPGVLVLKTLDDLRRHLEAHPGEDAVVLGPSVDQDAAFHLSDSMRITRTSLGVVLVRRRIDTPLLVDALRNGIREVVEERNLAGVNDAVRRVRDVAEIQVEVYEADFTSPAVRQ